MVNSFIKSTVIFLLFSASVLSAAEGIVFQRKNEPREAAFSLKVPKGWLMVGGVYRLMAHAIGGPLNALESKCDLTLKSDAKGQVYYRILPDIVYAHPQIGGGFFPIGSSYQGAEIKPFVNATTFVGQVFHYLHPHVTAKTLKLCRLAGEKEALARGMAHMNGVLQSVRLQASQSDVAGGAFEYEENGTRYREVILAAIINMPAALTWKNTRTLAFRAPAKEFDKWRPVMDIIRQSLQFNLRWLIKEFQGQNNLAQKAAAVFKEMSRIDQEIMGKSNITQSEIMNDSYLALTGQEEFVNPHTKEVERDTDGFRYRWTTAGGDMYYTNNESENPNEIFHFSGFERTPVRKCR